MDRSFKNVRKKLLLTYHGKSNLLGKRPDKMDRTDISMSEIAASISNGVIEFSGSRKYKTVYRGIEVIWKYDNIKDVFVILTYYKKRNSRKISKKKKFLLA
ncbi:hypothetical protein [Oceanobacillus oncorhynchi]|uniref:hypothetical protein n=1 Tax=Oceanobacillus oncorhynchi TaxID=545501 RepID=UPI0034D6E58E